MLKWWKSLTKRERFFAALGSLGYVLFAGLIVGNLVSGPNLNWDALSAIGGLISAVVACVAVFLAVQGYEASQAADRQEYRAYLNAKVTGARFKPNGALLFEVSIQNYGRTPAEEISIKIGGMYNVSKDGMMLLAREFEVTRLSAIMHPGKHDYVIETDYPHDEDVLQSLLANRGLLTYFGTVKYLDVFGKSQDEHFSGAVSATDIMSA